MKEWMNGEKQGCAERMEENKEWRLEWKCEEENVKRIALIHVQFFVSV